MPGKILRPGRYFLSLGAAVTKKDRFCYQENVLAFDVSQVGFHLDIIARPGAITPLFRWQVKKIAELEPAALSS